MLENRVELDVIAEVNVEVILGSARGLEHARAQQYWRARGARCARDLPGRHTDGDVSGCDPAFFVQLKGLGADGSNPSTGFLQCPRLAHEVGKPGRSSSEQHGHPARVGSGEVEGPGGQVAVPEQGIAATEVHEVPLPGAHCCSDPVRARVADVGGGLLAGVLRALTHDSRLTNRYAGRDRRGNRESTCWQEHRRVPNPASAISQPPARMGSRAGPHVPDAPRPRSSGDRATAS